MADAAPKQAQAALEGGTYEIIRKRLDDQGRLLAERLDKLNDARRAVFGTIEPKLLATERITTENNCTPADIAALGDTFLFAYNVQFGLKSTTEPKDVFAVYRLNGHAFEPRPLDLISDAAFLADFAGLYKYYKNTVFARFHTSGPHLYMVFRIGKSATDIKAFKWRVAPGGKLEYVDNRSDHEVRTPHQHEFEWKRATRDHYRDGKHPHISIEDRVFVECVGGDLTLKIEDNTKSGEGIYSEPVEDKEQKLDDAEISYASVGSIIILRIRPYREQKHRYIVFNEKIHRAVRCDEIGAACVLLPESQGLIFPNGYYLANGDFKRFDFAADDMMFERRIESPNGEDTLFAFFRREEGLYVLLSYNMIEQTVQTPVLCHGFSLFHQGEMLFFRAEQHPQKHHAVQIWQTPYVSPDYVPPVVPDSFLYKIGNKDLVRAMAECRGVAMLLRREDIYQGLYEDVHGAASALLDSFFWIRKPEAEGVGQAIEQIRDSAGAAIDEFEKVRRIRKATADRISAASKQAAALLDSVRPELMSRTDEFIGALAKLRAMRGEAIGLRELRYADIPAIDAIEKNLVERSDALSGACVEFLLRPDALAPWEERVSKAAADADAVSKGTDVKEVEERIAAIGKELETMVEVVGNLKIDDPTKSTRIIDGCSAIFTSLNTVRARLKNRRMELRKSEAVAEFAAQVRLLEQSLVGFLDVADTARKCDDALNKLMVQIEELEGRFADFDEYVAVLVEKRGEIASAIEARKLQIQEERGRRAASIHAAAERMLNAIRARVEAMKTEADIRAALAGDLMVEKTRRQIADLVALDETVRADELQSKLKAVGENAIRQLRDRQELFVEGENVMRLGRHLFTVNVQKPDLTILRRDDAMLFHITGTNFFEAVPETALEGTRAVWGMDVPSENAEVYRGEWLAWCLVQAAGTGDVPSTERLRAATDDEMLEVVRRFMAPRFEEGYTKGVHDADAARIARALAEIRANAGLLRFGGPARSLARVWWSSVAPPAERDRLAAAGTAAGRVIAAFPQAGDFPELRAELRRLLSSFASSARLHDPALCEEAADYLFHELARGGAFVVAPEAAHLHDEFLRVARERGLRDAYESSLAKMDGDLASRVHVLRGWIAGFLVEPPAGVDPAAAEEVVGLLATGSFDRGAVQSGSARMDVAGLTGAHPRVRDGRMAIDYPEFSRRLTRFERETVPAYRRFTEMKKKLSADFRSDLRLGEFEPRVLTSFVRNRLVDEVYLPMIGDNLAKQIGAAGAKKRTDLMGMLLLISPPGYGKTTLMEYVASKLGLVFAKINGPSLGHAVTSLDPEDAPNTAAREEIAKLNLALEVGDNIMIYVDDIQHCNPEFLQKFISLCDGQRRIEGVWRGKGRTHDLRGRKVCVAMAGNPYTESGEKFKIPDMLANRADTYNLGDIIGGHREAFELSFIENCLTSNPILQPLHAKSRKDVQALIRLATDPQAEGIELESGLSAEETGDCVAVLRKLFAVRDVLLKNNKQYILSAAQADAYRTEPPFKLQGSYRNMNKIAAKIVPLMNDDELRATILTHYEHESQTLATGAEANMLKFLELTGWADDAQRERWEEIKRTFRRNQRLHGADSGDHMANAIVQLNDLNDGMAAIRESLKPLGGLSDSLGGVGKQMAEQLARAAAPQQASAPQAIEVRIPEIRMPEVRIPEIRIPAAPPVQMPGSLQAEIGDASLEKLRAVLSEVRVRVEAPTMESSMEPTGERERPRGEFLSVGAMRTCLESNGFDVEEAGRGSFRIRRDANASIDLLVRNDRLLVKIDLGPAPAANAPLMARLLALNAEIQPVSFAIEPSDDGGNRLALLETRDGRNLTRAELVEVIRSMEAAGAKAGGEIR